MTQLELLKKYNKTFHEIIKLRYLTNQNNIKARLDAIPLKQYKKQVKRLKTMSDFDTLQAEIELLVLEKEHEELSKKQAKFMKEFNKKMDQMNKKIPF